MSHLSKQKLNSKLPIASKTEITTGTNQHNHAKIVETNVPNYVRSINIESLIKQSNEQMQVNNDELYADKYFDVSNEKLSIEFRLNENIEWLRPFELCQDEQKPRLGVYDVESISAPLQKQLGDCWFVSACRALFLQSNKSLCSQLLQSIFPMKQNESLKNGLVKCIFYVNGNQTDHTTVDVIIDDRLPVNKTTKEFIYGVCADKTHFWFSLLEKAYTKLYGANYENIIASVPEEAFFDLCGALTLYLNPQNKDDTDAIIEKLNWMKRRNALIACADTVPMRLSALHDSIKSHSFTIIDFTKSQNDFLVHLENTWSKSNKLNKEIVNANLSPDKNGNILIIRFKDFQKLYGALSLTLKIPSKDTIYECKGKFLAEKRFSNTEIITKKLVIKEKFLQYLKENGEFFLINVETSSIPNATQLEVIFNLTQNVGNQNKQRRHNELKLCLIEVSKSSLGLTANYSNRIESKRIGRTLSKILKITKQQEDNEALKQYLICAFSSNQYESPINYLFRCALLDEYEQTNQVLHLKKLQNLTDEKIELDINSCTDCQTIFLKDFTDTKYFVVNNLHYCASCQQKKRFNNGKSNVASLYNDYMNL